MRPEWRRERRARANWDKESVRQRWISRVVAARLVVVRSVVVREGRRRCGIALRVR